MFNKKTIFVCTLFISALTTAAVSKNDDWSKKMANFVGPVKKIYSINLNKEQFDPQEVETLKGAISDLKNTTHGLKFSVINFFSKKDPAIEAEYEQFKSNLDMADKTIAFSPKQSVFYIRSAVGQCAACHSNGGKSTHLFEIFKNTNMPMYEKARLSLAVRDYKTSAETFKSIMMDKDLQTNYFRMNDILVNYLNSAILSNYSKEQIISDLTAISKIATNKGTQNDLTNIIDDVKNSKPLASYDEAVKKFESYSGDLVTLDKSMYTSLTIKNLLHAKLRNLRSLDQKAASYEVLGDIYSHFPEISIFMVPEKYYELCVKTNPKSKVANECFKKYEDKIVLGYSGSMGSNVPDYEKAKIQKLKSLLK